MSAAALVPDRRGGRQALLKRALTADEQRDLEDVLAQASRLLTDMTIPAVAEIDDLPGAISALAWTRSSVLGALTDDEGAYRQTLGLSSLHDLISRTNQAESLIRTAELRGRDAYVRAAWEALANLQCVLSVPHLLKLGAEAVCQLGFDRAIVSRVYESTWITEAIHVDGDSAWAEEILTAGRQQPQMLAPGLPELDIMRRPRPILVEGVQQRSQVHKAVADASLSRAYVAAPIMQGSKVIGFLHGDRYFHRGAITSFDGDLLNLFAQGFGFALERALMAAEVDRIRAQVRTLAQDLSVIIGEDGAHPHPAQQPFQDPWRGAVSASTAPSTLHNDVNDRLTRREHEVLRLMAAGQTNQRIANHLVITEGTVKSHVKHILRKLHAANRAEAVARWHGAQPR